MSVPFPIRFSGGRFREKGKNSSRPIGIEDRQKAPFVSGPTHVKVHSEINRGFF